MKGIRKFFNDCLSDGDKVSSKRVITFASFVLLAVGFIANLFFDYQIAQFIYESIQWIVMIGLGATASEQFSKYKQKGKNEG